MLVHSRCTLLRATYILLAYLYKGSGARDYALADFVLHQKFLMYSNNYTRINNYVLRIMVFIYGFSHP